MMIHQTLRSQTGGDAEEQVEQRAPAIRACGTPRSAIAPVASRRQRCARLAVLIRFVEAIEEEVRDDQVVFRRGSGVVRASSQR